MELRLLTEAQAISAHMKDRDEFLTELRERGLIAPEPDPLLVEAREIAANAFRGKSLDDLVEETLSARNDHSATVEAALAALRRGMELAQPKVTRERLLEACVEGGVWHFIAHQFDTQHPTSQRRLDRLHAALQEQLKEAGRG